ncbi:hypothetical protein AMTRI_Chr03g55710 [Amborella trichopoda]
MEFGRKVVFSGDPPLGYSFSGELPANKAPEAVPVLSPQSVSDIGSFTSLEEFLPDEKSFSSAEEGNIGLEWLSEFVEDCFSGEIPATHPPVNHFPAPSHMKPLHPVQIPCKARTKRRRRTCHLPVPTQSTDESAAYDPPLLHQAYWLAESELIIQTKPENEPSNGSTHILNESLDTNDSNQLVTEADEGVTDLGSESLDRTNESCSSSQPRRCTHCLAQRTPQWRAGPLGPKTLCNACGVRFKSGRLLPEYRPAKSPSFLSYKHSNSHKKVMEMRMAL